MASIREQVLARIAAALLNATPAGANVSRSREVSITRAQTPAIVVMPSSTELLRQAEQVDRHHFTVKVEVFTRGDPWDSLADSCDVAIHQVLMTDAPLRALAGDIRRISEEFDSQEADRTAGTLTLTYRLTWLARAADVTAAP